MYPRETLAYVHLDSSKMLAVTLCQEKLEIIQMPINLRIDPLKWHSHTVEYYTVVKNGRVIALCNNMDKSL